MFVGTHPYSHWKLKLKINSKSIVVDEENEIDNNEIGQLLFILQCRTLYEETNGYFSLAGRLKLNSEQL